MAKRKSKVTAKANNSRKWLAWITAIVSAISALAALGFFMLVLLVLLAGSATPIGNVAVIPIEGPIMVDGQPGWGESLTSSTKVLKLLDQIDEDPTIKAVVLEINSPGGSAVASAEIGDRIKQLDIPVYSVIRSTGASGAYWIASSSDKIYAHKYAVTGSIGVIGSYLEFADFLRDYNITYRRMVSGKYKDAGSPFKKQTNAEREIFQTLLDDIHEGFIEEVANNRNLTKEEVTKLATGQVYLGFKAKDLGLVDELGGMPEVVKEIETKLNITADLARYSTKKTFVESLSASTHYAAYNIGRGIGTSLKPSNQFEIIS